MGGGNFGSGGTNPGTGGSGDGGTGTGSADTGGTGGGGPITVGPCGRTVGSCEEPEVTVTEIDFGVAITPYGNEWDTLPLPAALASMPSGGTRVAARGTDGRIHIATLDCDDEMVGTPITLDAVDLQDIHADDEGGAVLLTRPGPGSGDDSCGPINTCDSSSSPCYNSFIVRFDHTGEVWATPVTNLSESQDAYQNGARFVWERYQHHGRLAFDGTNYAAYFAIAITTPGNQQCAKPGGVDVHEGDRMQVVSSSGMLLSHPQAMAVGCSHSWTTRIVWDPRNSKFMMVCATDNPDTGSGSLNTGKGCRIARPGPYRTVAAEDCTGQFWGGDLVLAEGSGYWTAYTQNGSAHLVRFTDDGPQQTVSKVASTDHVKLVRFGAGKMLLAWGSGSAMRAQVYDATDATPIGEEFDIPVEDHNYHAFKAFPDGSVAYPARGSTSTSLRVARVMACE